jgi:hypothetical protein
MATMTHKLHVDPPAHSTQRSYLLTTRQSTDNSSNVADLFSGSSVTNVWQDKTLIASVAMCALVGILLFIVIGCLLCCYRDEGPCWQGRRVAGSVPIKDEESSPENERDAERATRAELREVLRGKD